MSARPRIAVFTLGGTIASVPRDGEGAGVVPTLGSEELLAAVPALREVADVEAVSFRQLPSPEIAPADVVELARAIGERVAAGCAGAVVTQGTDSLEETAFALDLLTEGEAPVVATGAMRDPAQPGADGPANLLAAAQAAAAPACRGLGAIVAFAGELHWGRYVRKTHTSSIATFRSPTVGPLGWVSEGVARVALRPAQRRWLRASELGPIPPVALLTAGPGHGDGLLGAVAGTGWSGLVVEGLGGGHVPAALVDELEHLAAAMPVVLASRTGAGEVLTRTYGFPGSEQDLLARGLIRAGALDGPKARVLLALAMAAGAGRDGVARAFEAIGVPGTGADGPLEL